MAVLALGLRLGAAVAHAAWTLNARRAGAEGATWWARVPAAALVAVGIAALPVR